MSLRSASLERHIYLASVGGRSLCPVVAVMSLTASMGRTASSGRARGTDHAHVHFLSAVVAGLWVGAWGAP